ncbi:MAG: hypothetical protein ACE5KM_13490 [Planctomycetaceae bacterium]
MGILENLNDDQTALLGCAVALLLCGGAMVLSHTLRRWITGTAARRETPIGQTAGVAEGTKAVPDTRKAA